MGLGAGASRAPPSPPSLLLGAGAGMQPSMQVSTCRVPQAPSPLPPLCQGGEGCERAHMGCPPSPPPCLAPWPCLLAPAPNPQLGTQPWEGADTSICGPAWGCGPRAPMWSPHPWPHEFPSWCAPSLALAVIGYKGLVAHKWVEGVKHVNHGQWGSQQEGTRALMKWQAL